MQDAHRPPRAAARSPRRASACSRRREPVRSFPRSPWVDPMKNVGYAERHLRRLLVLAFLAALTAVPAASAAFQPIRRDFGELTYPRVRAGKLTIPKGHSDG